MTTDTTPTSDRTLAGSGDGEEDGANRPITLRLNWEELSFLSAAVQFGGAFAPGGGFKQNAMKMFVRLASLQIRTDLDGSS